MRFMVMHKVDAHMEAGLPPSQDIIQGMGSFIQGDLAAGVFLDGAGLHRSAQRVRLTCVAGDCTVTRGPYAGGNELVAGFAIDQGPVDGRRHRARPPGGRRHRRHRDRDRPGRRTVGPRLHGEARGPRDQPVPAPAEGRCALRSSAGPTEQQRQALRQLTDELDKAGVLLTTERLAPSAQATRLRAAPKGQRRTWVDGPFTESKELVAGFSIIEVPTRADAIAWAERYAAILDGNEVDVRPLAGRS